MAVSFTRFSCWVWGGKKKIEPVPNRSSLNSSSEPDAVKFSKKLSSSSRKVKQKWDSREEKRCFEEFDLVVLSGSVCLSGSESDGPEWSIGWEEPHGPEFQIDNNDEEDGGFAVLVPCYTPSCKGVVESPNNQSMNAIHNLPKGISTDGKNCMEQWLSSIRACGD